eukprot:1750337-Amphidinium_carterae.1
MFCFEARAHQSAPIPRRCVEPRVMNRLLQCQAVGLSCALVHRLCNIRGVGRSQMLGQNMWLQCGRDLVATIIVTRSVAKCRVQPQMLPTSYVSFKVCKFNSLSKFV